MIIVIWCSFNLRVSIVIKDVLTMTANNIESFETTVIESTESIVIVEFI